MQVNELPPYDFTDNPTGCCPRFHPEGWDGAELHLHDMPMLRATTHSVLHVPVDMGPVFSRVLGHIETAGAFPPGGYLALSRDASAFGSEHLFAVTKDVPGEEMTHLSGDFLMKVFEGGYAQARHWHEEMQALVRARGKEPGAIWFFYTTCPKCAKAYGKNYVVGVAEV